MKKLTLTFCALFALLVVAPALYADDGPEKYSGKEKEVMQPAPPVCDIYRAHEWDLDIWGAWMFSANPGHNHFDKSRNSEGELNADPFSPDQDPFTFDYATGVTTFPAFQNPNERINLGAYSKDALMGRDDTFGGGVDVKYFWSRYFGAGLEGLGLAAKRNFAGGGLVTLTARYPFGRFAPYITGGIGFIDGGAQIYTFFNEKHLGGSDSIDPGSPGDREFLTYDPVSNHHLRALGQIGAGLEYRVTCHIGLMADFTWNFVFGQEDHPDKFFTVTEQGTITFTDSGTPVSSTTITNTATTVKPGHSSDNQDFGMVRFGLTFSY